MLIFDIFEHWLLYYKTDHSLQNVLSGIRIWNMQIRPLVVSALIREVVYIFSIKQVPVVDSVKMLECCS